MTPKNRARRPADQAKGDALPRQVDGSTSRPTREQAFEAFCVFLAYAMGQHATPTVYTADALPPDATSRDAFLRRHRERMRERAPGWTRSGKVRAVTTGAWAADVAAETARSRAPRRAPRLKVVEPAKDLDAEVARELGIRIRPGASR